MGGSFLASKGGNGMRTSKDSLPICRGLLVAKTISMKIKSIVNDELVDINKN
jgi:hypothetical protein